MRTTKLEDLRAANAPADAQEYADGYEQADLAGKLAELVYNLRRSASLTQTELARRMGTTQSAIARLEGAGHVPTVDVLVRLGAATGTPITLTTELGHAIHLSSA